MAMLPSLTMAKSQVVVCTLAEARAGLLTLTANKEGVATSIVAKVRFMLQTLEENVVRLSVTFRSPGHGQVDPDSVVLTLQDPALNLTTPTPVLKDSVGNYHYDFYSTSTDIGIWAYRWQGIGGGADSAVEGHFEILETAILPQPTGGSGSGS